ncbi:MAG: CDP-diacylglycerol diphosphatase, partial [Bacteriovorax sp.]
SHMEKLYNAPIPDDEISLAINSQRGRSQNQLHIHISCVRQDVKAKIQKNLKSIGEVWKKIPGGLLGHKYFARRITLEQLKDQNAFQLLSNDLAHSKDSMKKFGLGLVVIKNEAASFDYILLADRMKIWTEDLGHVEEIQDHKCPQLIK